MVRRKPIVHPATAVFAVLLAFASLYLPPYQVDFDHWLPLVATATAIRDGMWPYLGGYDSGYGFLRPAFLAAWLACFGLSALSLSALLMCSSLIAGAAAFALIHRLTTSRVVALLGALYPLQGIGEYTMMAARAFAVSSSFRAPVQIALCALLLYLSLRDRPSRVVCGFLFGLAALWDPPFGGFAAAGFVFAHGCLMLRAAPGWRAGHLWTVGAMLAAIALTLSFAWAGSAVAVGPLEIYRSISSTGALFLFGYANMAQHFDPVVIVAFLVGVLYLALVLLRWSRSRRLTRRHLFVGASLIGAVPYVLYAMGSSDAVHYLPAYWALMPSAAFLFYLFGRAQMLRSRGGAAVRRTTKRSARAFSAIAAAGLGVVAYLWGWFPLDRVLAIDNFSARYELTQQKWQRDCASAATCDKARPPSLSDHLRQANRPLWEAGLLGFDPALLAACRQGLVILSYADAWVYATAGCSSPLGIASASFTITRGKFEELIGLLQQQEQIVIDPVRTRYADWRGDILADVKSRLIKQGFTETAGCGRFSILSRGDPAPSLRRICAA